jgi:Kyakuja-Dileera-Zisupton transposase
MNMDYSICRALQYNTTGLVEALVEYDIACSWSVNFAKRLEASDFLSLPKGMQIIPAVGKFHLSTHKSDCFVKFSLNFIDGAGQQDGEILETLWASLNKSASSTRAMTKSHRQEVLDNYVRDSNWKKLVHMGL